MLLFTVSKPLQYDIIVQGTKKGDIDVIITCDKYQCMIYNKRNYYYTKNCTLSPKPENQTTKKYTQHI